MSRNPFASLLSLTLVLILGLLWAGFLLGGIEYAYRRIGIPEGAMFGLLLATLVGSQINIPIARLEPKSQEEPQVVNVLGIPVRLAPQATVLAVNLGGAVIPTGMSVYLIIKDSIWWQSAVGVAFVALIVHLIARPVEDVGIEVPGLIPPLLAAAIALLIDPHMAAAVAYVSGTLGTLIGADLTNLNNMGTSSGGVASIGGAGTFDAVFLSGIVAVLLVAVV